MLGGHDGTVGLLRQASLWLCVSVVEWDWAGGLNGGTNVLSLAGTELAAVVDWWRNNLENRCNIVSAEILIK